MNKVYKAVWNEVKNCYSVVSEIAKNRRKSSSRRKKNMVTLMVFSLLSVGGLSYAEPTLTPDQQVVYDAVLQKLETEKKTAHYFSINSTDKGAGSNYNNDGAIGSGSIAIGPQAVVKAPFASAFGNDAKAKGVFSTAIGLSAQAEGDSGVAVGKYATETGECATAVGPDSKANGKFSIALGSAAIAKGRSSTAVGSTVMAEGKNSIALGSDANAKGNNSIALGSNVNVEGNNSIALGSMSSSVGESSIALGGKAKTKAQGSVALGEASLADREAGVWGLDIFTGQAMNEDVLLGAGKAAYDEAKAKLTELQGQAQTLRNECEASLAKDKAKPRWIGIISAATRALREKLREKEDQVAAQAIQVAGFVKVWSATEGAISVGSTERAITRQITGVAAGTEDTDAVNVAQLKKVASTLDEKITVLNGKVGALDTKVNRVGAGAAALAGLHPLDYDPDNKFDFAAGYGHYKGANALAIGAFYRPDENKIISIGGSFGGGENMVSAGVSVKLGQGTGISTSKVAMAKEIKNLKIENERMQEENREMKQEIEVLKEQMQKLLAGK